MPSRQVQGTFEPFIEKWDLARDGTKIETPFSRLLPVRRDGEALMLKLLLFPEERRGSRVMQWWEGDGAARVLEIDANAVLMERATGKRSLAQMAVEGQDADASRILANTAQKLHGNRDKEPPADAVSLDHWFRSLWSVEKASNPFLQRAELVARELIDHPANEHVLHGDIHHGNVLDFEERGWLAIDPKGLIGETAFDFANIFRNPPAGHQFEPGRMERSARVISEEIRISEERLLQWVVAYTGLSASGAEKKSSEYEADLVIGETAARLLGLSSGIPQGRRMIVGDRIVK